MEKAKKEMLQSLSAVNDAMESFVSAQKKYTVALTELNPSTLSTDDTETGGKRKRVAKVPKDPDAPKKPASSYLLFQNEIRAQLKKENSDMNHNELTRHIAAMWAAMSTEDRTVWNDRSDTLKKKYNLDFAAYAAEHPEKDLKKTKKEKTAPAKPAQAPSAKLEAPSTAKPLLRSAKPLSPETPSAKPPSAKPPSAKPPSAKPPSAKPPSAKPLSAKTLSAKPSSSAKRPSKKPVAPTRPAAKKQQQQESSSEEESEEESSEEEEEQVVVQPVRKKAKTASSLKRK